MLLRKSILPLWVGLSLSANVFAFWGGTHDPLKVCRKSTGALFGVVKDTYRYSSAQTPYWARLEDLLLNLDDEDLSKAIAALNPADLPRLSAALKKGALKASPGQTRLVEDLAQLYQSSPALASLPRNPSPEEFKNALGSAISEIKESPSFRSPLLDANGDLSKNLDKALTSQEKNILDVALGRGSQSIHGLRRFWTHPYGPVRDLFEFNDQLRLGSGFLESLQSELRGHDVPDITRRVTAAKNDLAQLEQRAYDPSTPMSLYGLRSRMGWLGLDQRFQHTTHNHGSILDAADAEFESKAGSLAKYLSQINQDQLRNRMWARTEQLTGLQEDYENLLSQNTEEKKPGSPIMVNAGGVLVPMSTTSQLSFDDLLDGEGPYDVRQSTSRVRVREKKYRSQLNKAYSVLAEATKSDSHIDSKHIQDLDKLESEIKERIPELKKYVNWSNERIHEQWENDDPEHFKLRNQKVLETYEALTRAIPVAREMLTRHETQFAPALSTASRDADLEILKKQSQANFAAKVGMGAAGVGATTYAVMNPEQVHELQMKLMQLLHLMPNVQ